LVPTPVHRVNRGRIVSSGRPGSVTRLGDDDLQPVRLREVRATCRVGFDSPHTAVLVRIRLAAT
jgi:hypothetical protein